jgi:predicted MFS family arabinose efflux permease
MAIFMMAVPIGGLMSFAVTGPAAQAWGWRIALAMAALPAAALVPALLWLKEPPRQQAKSQLSAGDLSLAHLLRSSAFWWIVISGAVVNFALYSFSTFLPAFLTRFHGLSVGAAGLWTGIGAGAAGIAGALTAASLGDRTPGHPARGRMMFAAAAAALAAPLALLSISRPAGQAAIAIPLIMAAYGLLQTYYGLVYAAIQDIVPPGLRGAAMGTYFMAMYLCGASFGPLFTGALSDRMARAAAGAGPLTEAARAYGLRDAMYVIPALSVVLALVLWAGARASASVAAQE